jgi:hypothetical protein
MSEWVRAEAERIRAEVAQRQAKDTAKANERNAIVALSRGFWDEVVRSVTADAAAFEKEFPDDPHRHFEVTSLAEWAIQIKYQERALRVRGSKNNIAVQAEQPRSDGLKEQTHLPALTLVLHGTELRASDGALNYTPRELSEKWLRQLMARGSN